MTPEQIQSALLGRFTKVDSLDDRIEIRVGELKLIVVAHADTGRLRIMIPIAVVDRPNDEAFERLLEANFATTLDARYAIYNQVLWAVFLAPLSAVNEHYFDSALSEVLELARSVGTAYCAWPTLLGAGFNQIH